MNQFFVNNFPRFFARFASDVPSEETQNDNIELAVVPSTSNEESHPSERNGFKEKLITDCKDISEVLQLFDFSIIKDELEKLDETLLLKIHLDQHFGTLRSNELQQLNKKCRNKSIVVFFASRNQNKFSIYWKSKEIQNFLTLSLCNETLETDKSIYEFIAYFLADSLANGHLGLHNSIARFTEKEENIKVKFIADSRNYNLLLIAAELGRNDIVKILLDENPEAVLSDKQNEITAQDLAWQAKHYDVVLTLMKAGVTYPKSFDLNKCSIELKEFCKESEKLHTEIIAGDETKIKEILSHSPNPHPFYNRFNESAAKIALVSKLIDIYKILVTHGVFLGRHETLHDLWGNFDEFDQEILRKIHFKNSIHKPEKHLDDLLNCSSVSHDDKNPRENLNHAKYAFKILNQINFVRIILMIVAANRKLNKIIFDFKSTSVDVVDPSASPTARGMFYTKGAVCVGASFLLDRLTEHETFGTLAHELCHFAMFLVYRNMARPYRRKDGERRREFTRIAKICEQNRKKEEMIDLAFRYPLQMQHAELIVRVPHLMALYHNQPEKLKEVRENFKELFGYYEQIVVTDMEKALPRIEKEIQRMDQKILKNKIISIFTIFLSMIIIVAGFFVVRSIFYTPTFNFNELSREEQINVENSFVNYKNVHIQFRDLFSQDPFVYGNLTSEHISQMLSGEILNFGDPHLHYLDVKISHNWENLTVKLKHKILSSSLIFQNESIKFENLNENSQNAFKYFTSEQIVNVLDGEELTVHKIIRNRTAVYVERNFWDSDSFAIYKAYKKYINKNYGDIEDDNTIMKLYVSEERLGKFYEEFKKQNASTYVQKINEMKKYSSFLNPGLLASIKKLQENFETIFKKSEKSKMFILSGEAGTGKTTTFEQFTIRIKEKFPARWVSYIDMKDFTTFYNKNESLGNVLGLLEKILELNSKNGFERKFFEELFKSGEVVLFWNGFDEISPKYSDFILNLLDLIHKTTNNTQFICTRPLYSELLRSKFGISHHELVPFDKKNQNEYLKKFFNYAGIAKNEIQNFTNKVYKIVNTLKGRKSADFNTPLMLEMIANLISNDVEVYESENLWEIYEKFIKRKIQIWHDKDDFAFNFTKNSWTDNRGFDMMRLYQIYALKYEIPAFFFVKFNIYNKLKIMQLKVPKELTSAEISRMGILYINGEDNFRFAHKTFAEFFVAQFFIESIYKADFVDPEDAVFIIQLFSDVTREYILGQVIITNFMKAFLQMRDRKQNEQLDPGIANVIEKKFKNLFFNLLETGWSEIFEFLFEFFKNDHKLLVELLHVNANETLYTASFNSAYFLECNLDRKLLKDLGKKHLNEKEYEKFIHGRNQKGIVLFSLYRFYESDRISNRNRTIFHDEYDLDEEILQTTDTFLAFEMISKKLSKDELRELLVSNSSLVTWNEFDLLQHEKFWDIVNSSLTHQEQKLMISNFFYRISTSSNQNLILLLIEKTEFFLSDSEILEIFLDKNSLQWAASRELEKFEKLWSFFVKHTDRIKQKEILLREIDGECIDAGFIPNEKCHYFPAQNILHILLVTSYASTKGKVINSTKLYENYFSKAEMQDIITKSNDFLPYFIEKNGHTEHADFVSYLKTLFNGSEKIMKDFLNRKIKPTNLSIFNFFENDPDVYFGNFEIFNELLQS